LGGSFPRSWDPTPPPPPPPPPHQHSRPGISHKPRRRAEVRSRPAFQEIEKQWNEIARGENLFSVLLFLWTAAFGLRENLFLLKGGAEEKTTKFRTSEYQYKEERLRGGTAWVPQGKLHPHFSFKREPKIQKAKIVHPHRLMGKESARRPEKTQIARFLQSRQNHPLERKWYPEGPEEGKSTSNITI